MRIYAIHDSSGCGHYRVKLPMRQLRKHGHDVKLVPGDAVVNEEAMGYPVIVAERVDKPDALPIWRRMRATSKLVYELDDDVWNVDPTNWQAWRVYGRPDTLDAVAHAAEVANLVTVSTPPLAEIMRQYNDNVVVLPNCVPAYVCDLPVCRDPGRPTVGWSGGASHGPDMMVVASAMRRFLDRFPAWTMSMLGTNFAETIRHERVDFTPWIQITDDAKGFYRAVDYDIGIAPLSSGGVRGEFNKSKSHIKALEYAARGIPTVATDAPPYHDFVEHGKTGFLVRRDHEWLKYLSELAADLALREQMGAAAREKARQWTIEGRWREWADVYGGLR